MPAFAILFGGLLTALGAVAYFFSPEVFGGDTRHAMTAAIPAFVGIPILLTGLATLANPALRKHAMHAAAILGLVGAVGGFVPALRGGFDFGKVSVQVGLLMAALSAVFLVLCVKSFVDARRSRQATAAAGTAAWNVGDPK
ncbi:MAG: hypothetical protein C0501_15700 [Isosphaera sp.]|nr:hypothetical protein [Isosphaera sp.]